MQWIGYVVIINIIVIKKILLLIIAASIYIWIDQYLKCERANTTSVLKMYSESKSAHGYEYTTKLRWIRFARFFASQCRGAYIDWKKKWWLIWRKFLWSLLFETQVHLDFLQSLNLPSIRPHSIHINIRFIHHKDPETQSIDFRLLLLFFLYLPHLNSRRWQMQRMRRISRDSKYVEESLRSKRHYTTYNDKVMMRKRKKRLWKDEYKEMNGLYINMSLLLLHLPRRGIIAKKYVKILPQTWGGIHTGTMMTIIIIITKYF